MNETDQNPPLESAPKEGELGFLLHNISMTPQVRHLRNSNPLLRGVVNVHTLGPDQRRILPERPIAVSQEHLTTYREGYLTLIGSGLLSVTNLLRQRVDIASFSVVEPAQTVSPRPNFLLDSAANDYNPQAILPSQIDQIIPPSDFRMPVPPPPASLDMAEIAEQERINAELESSFSEPIEGVTNFIPPTPEDTAEQMEADRITAENQQEIVEYANEKRLQVEENPLVVPVDQQPAIPPSEEVAEDAKSSVDEPKASESATPSTDKKKKKGNQS